MLALLLSLASFAGPPHTQTITAQDTSPEQRSLGLTDGRSVVLYATEDVQFKPGTYTLSWSEEAGTHVEINGVKRRVMVVGEHPITQIESACIEKDSSTAGMLRCTAEATRLWDVELNRVYKHLMTHLDPEAKAALQTAQRAWIPYRDGEIGVIRATYGRRDGTIWRLVAAAEIQGLTSERTARLWDLAAPAM